RPRTRNELPGSIENLAHRGGVARLAEPAVAVLADHAPPEADRRQGPRPPRRSGGSSEISQTPGNRSKRARTARRPIPRPRWARSTKNSAIRKATPALTWGGRVTITH